MTLVLYEEVVLHPKGQTNVSQIQCQLWQLGCTSLHQHAAVSVTDVQTTWRDQTTVVICSHYEELTHPHVTLRATWLRARQVVPLLHSSVGGMILGYRTSFGRDTSYLKGRLQRLRAHLWIEICRTVCVNLRRPRAPWIAPGEDDIFPNARHWCKIDKRPYRC